MTRYLVAIAVVVMTTNLDAETLSFPSFQIEIEDGWEHSIEAGPSNGWGSIISVYRPNGAGILRMRSYLAPAVVSDDTLRNMTNLDLSTPLTRQNWGDYSGYQHSYSERGSYYRQWWLTNERAVIFLAYQCDPAAKDQESDEIDRIVRSISANNTGRDD